MTKPPMKCTRCSRPLIKPHWISGSVAVGPKCAKLMGLTIGTPRKPGKARKTVRAAPVHPDQIELFTEASI